MKGDFSIWHHDLLDNDQGLLYQQGRVMRDADMTAAELIGLQWRSQAGRDVIGAGVAAAPAEDPTGFKVDSATAAAGEVRVQLLPGRLWADGLLVHLPPDPASPTQERVATYLDSPPNPAGADVSSIANGMRDAVILEVALEELNAFQDSARLIEPALGGPDTAERIVARHGLRLLRLGPGEDCGNILDKLVDGPSGKGRLSVSLEPPDVIVGECPVVAGGGYTGFEHNLYRVEIAHVNAGPAHFKWSALNGSLVGRGTFHAGAPKRVVIRDNRPAIVHAGLTEFYLEALQYDADLGHWRVVYTAVANLNSDFDLELTDPPVYGAFTASAELVFFRLWNGLEPISAFTNAATPQPLQDGIRLVFDAPGADASYRPGDYWVFSVRAGEVENPEILIDEEPPLGPLLRRVPLAILNWTGAPPVTVQGAAGEIDDCRRVFQPLTRLKACCTYTVGDGLGSFGQFDTIQAAINALPASGGEVCVLPGQYTENLVIDGKDNVVVKGCGARSQIVSDLPAGGAAAAPVITITDAEHVRVESLALNAHGTGPGVVVSATPASSHVVLHDLSISAATRSGIEVQGGSFVTIDACRVTMNDVASPWPGVFVIGEDVLIRTNVVRVQRAAGATGDAAGRGGLQIGGTSERVRVIDNHIEGGIGNGITLGTVEEVPGVEATGATTLIAWVVDADDPCSPCAPGNVYLPPPTGGGGGTSGPTYRSAGALHEILIEDNRILDMGLNGIGVVAFFDLAVQDEFISVEGLRIARNEICGCLRRPLAVIIDSMIDAMGYGGIALADVENLAVQHNLIEDNGPNHLEPVCGVFVLHAEGMDVSHNRIVNNGAKTNEPSHTAKNGRRGGINVVLAVAPTVPTPILGQLYPVQDGVAAATIHDNIVSQPLGQALALDALGSVSVANNHLTSRGVVLKTNPPSPSLFAATVLIMNFGVANELYGQLFTFSGVAYGTGIIAAGPSLEGDAVLLAREGLDDKRIGQYLANGNVLFSDNRCDLNLLESGVGFAISSVAIFSLDDVGFHANQCDCNLLDEFVLTQALLFAASVRASDNRFKEGVFNALYSGVTVGLMNATTGNQSTHCLLVLGLAALKVDGGNRALIEAFAPGYCGDGKSALGAHKVGYLGALLS